MKNANGIMKAAVVVIGRNEGERLKRCIGSLKAFMICIYVDSGSTDGSADWARAQGFDVVVLTDRFTAARARNAGFFFALKKNPDLQYIQFIDGDCELDPNWPMVAKAFLDATAKASAVFGRRREKYPDKSFYNYICDREWNTPLGEVRSFGGDVMVKAIDLARCEGYRSELIAGEEPELCLRLRQSGGVIFRIDQEMTLHDANIRSFKQWWSRQIRSGYAFANVSHLHCKGAERLWSWETKRAILWGVILPISIFIVAAFNFWLSLILLAVYPIQYLRRISKIEGHAREKCLLAFFELTGRTPEALGVVRYFFDAMFKRSGGIIEYK